MRHEPAGLEGEALDAHTTAWVEAVNRSGAAYLTPAVLDGRWMARVSIGALATEEADVAAVWAAMREAAEGLASEERLRPPDVAAEARRLDLRTRPNPPLLCGPTGTETKVVDASALAAMLFAEPEAENMASNWKEPNWRSVRRYKIFRSASSRSQISHAVYVADAFEPRPTASRSGRCLSSINPASRAAALFRIAV